MPRIHNNPDIEMDRCHTPLEHRRRAEMKIRRVRFGFFRVGEKTEPTRCCKCKRDITHIDHTRLNGVPYCWGCRF